jgi:hypothetical protein
MSLRSLAGRVLSEVRLPTLARLERRRDRQNPLEDDPGIDASVRAALHWIARAQDHSTTRDGGVAHSFSTREGWTASYPETTGYIVPTMLDCAIRFGDPELGERGRRMLDWLVAIQFAEGGFQGGVIGATPRVPVTFNTGQILLGLAAGAARDGRYLPAMRKAADWLAGTQDDDGCWRRFPTPFAAPSEKAYETHVSWGLYEALRVEKNPRWLESANRQVRWALRQQQPNGWFDKNCLNDPQRPLTHTIGYVLRGVLEAWRYTNDPDFLAAAERCGRGVLGALESEGRLAGRIDRNWNPAVSWVCLTGSVQIAHCWLLLFQATGDPAFRDAAFAANTFVRRSMRWSGDPGVIGGIKGSLPIDGGYMTWVLPNWAAKFFVDSNLLEAAVRG